jgi:hypothetical protein
LAAGYSLPIIDNHEDKQRAHVDETFAFVFNANFHNGSWNWCKVLDGRMSKKVVCTDAQSPMRRAKKSCMAWGRRCSSQETHAHAFSFGLRTGVRTIGPK